MMMLLRFFFLTFLLGIEICVDEVVVTIVALRDDKTIDFKLGDYISRGKNNELSRQTNTWVSPFYLHHRT